ncbi:Bbp16 family capsid cement protein [Variovorax sp.]|uniref:Bbp16 family capsid cement protein n=1 Tax=Variovorax sp. TaxID=1871043 RepID=UPI003BAD6CDD
MILDNQNLFSDDQAITATAASTNVIDLGPTGTVPRSPSALTRDISKGTDIPLLVQVTEAFNNLTSLAVAVQTDSDSAFGSATTLYTQTVVLADLTAGKRIALKTLPYGLTKRYVRLNYTVTGTAPTTGKVTAGITAGNDETLPL